MAPSSDDGPDNGPDAASSDVVSCELLVDGICPATGATFADDVKEDRGEGIMFGNGIRTVKGSSGTELSPRGAGR